MSDTAGQAAGGGDAQRLARAALTRVVDPGDRVLGRMVEEEGPVAVLAGIRDGTSQHRLAGPWRSRLVSADAERDLADCVRAGGRFLCPGDEEWPAAVDDLGLVRPLGLWVRGALDLHVVSRRAVAMVGSRAATAYGMHVASDVAAGLAERGWAVVSGGAFGIDAAGHRGALAVGGITVAVLASGVDVPYPRSHAALFDRIADEGLLVSEMPPGSSPTRTRFLVRNRLIAALSAGTVVVEAALRSGARSTAKHAGDIGRDVMAVPGPVTSALSAGAHDMIRNGAICVTDATEVIDAVGMLGVDLAPEKRGPTRVHDALDSMAARVFDVLPARSPVRTDQLAVAAGVDADVALRSLGVLLGLGLAERSGGGWRLGVRANRTPTP